MKAIIKYLAGLAGPSGYGSKSTAEQVTRDCSSSSTFLPSSHLTAIITGATSGIGAETARVLAKRGVRIIIPARNLKKAALVKENIQKESPEADITILEIDLSSFASVKRFCTEFLSLGLPLHILINNAGKFSQNLEFSEDKIEMTFATNYLEMLLERMVETAAETGIEGRIVNVSSVIHNWVKRDDFSFYHMLNPRNYNGTRAYAQSKLANILHARELARQLKERTANVTINAVHPGIVKTGIIRDHKGFITGMDHHSLTADTFPFCIISLSLNPIAHTEITRTCAISSFFFFLFLTTFRISIFYGIKVAKIHSTGLSIHDCPFTLGR
ncbi:unnamed protein product [Coffea canephora]|uniref:Short-chain dehydrogenase TIC 32, chloroplastic-like n=1 Tax=Coffea canephora TaxID=49390 RepID=A0A068V8X6_COFCA|nr:unnamed protein product [Coffea canephora]